MTLSRRQFFGVVTGAVAGVTLFGIPGFTEMIKADLERTPVLWLQGQSCSGCSISFLNTSKPDILEVLTKIISLKAHMTLSTATGEVFTNAVKETIASKNYILLVEGSVPTLIPEACVMAGVSFVDQLKAAAANAKAIVSVGTCAAFGGIPAAEGNLTGSKSVIEVLKDPKVINIPGCPIHPDWVVGTIFHLTRWGMPELNDFNCPTEFYATTIHDRCPRFPAYEREDFASKPGESGCLFKLGCLGPNVRADCPQRMFNGVNNCIKSGSPCVGCVGYDFARYKSDNFYR